MYNKKMLKSDVINQFKRDVLFLKYQDTSSINQAWNDFTDSLYKDNLISEKSFNTWGNPLNAEGINQRKKRLVKAHILSFYNLNELKKQVKSMRYNNNNSDYNIINKMVNDACFKVSHYDISNFIETLKIPNKSNKIFTNEETWELYKHLLGMYGTELLELEI